MEAPATLSLGPDDASSVLGQMVRIEWALEQFWEGMADYILFGVRPNLEAERDHEHAYD